MKRAVLTVCLCLAALGALGGCKSDELKQQLTEKSKIIADKEAEISRLKDEMATREAELKSQMEQKIQKLTAQSKQQVDALNAKLAEFSKKKEAEKNAKSPPAKPVQGKTGKKSRS